MTSPIIATLQSSSCVFEVKCEATGEWLTPAYGTRVGSTEEQKSKIREIVKKAQNKFYKLYEQHGKLYLSYPCGFWLNDGRLVSPNYKEGKKVEAYYGDKSEIINRNRTIQYILSGRGTFLPSESKR